MLQIQGRNQVVFKPFDNEYDYLSLPIDDIKYIPMRREVNQQEHLQIKNFVDTHFHLFRFRSLLPFLLDDFLKANLNNFTQTEKNIQNYFNWLDQFIRIRLSKSCLEMLKLGVIYIEGRDESERPIIVINPSRIDFNKYKKAEIYAIMSRCFIIVQAYMLNYGKIDQWRIIIDGEYEMEFQLNYGFILFLIEKFNHFFPNSLYQLYFIRFNKYLNHEKKEMFKYMIPEATRSKVFFIFEEEEYKSLIIKTMDLSSLEMKFGGLKMNFKQFWRIYEGSQHMDDADLTREYMMLEETIEREMIEYMSKFIQYLKSLGISNIYINQLLIIFEEEFIILKQKYKTPEELEEEERQRERVKRSKRQKQEQEERERQARIEWELQQKIQYELYLQQQMELRRQQELADLNKRLQYQEAQTRYVDYQDDYDQNYKVFNKFQYQEVQQVQKVQQYEEPSLEYNIYTKQNNFNVDLGTANLKSEVPMEKELNYFVMQKRYEPSVQTHPHPQPQAQVNMVTSNQQQQQQSRQGTYQKQNTQQRETQQGIVQIDQQYQFNDNNKSISVHNSSKLDDLNISKISLTSQDKVIMNNQFKDPNLFVEGFKEEEKKGGDACTIF